MSRPQVLLSSALSLDGCIDDCSPERLILSSSEDWEAVDRLRADCDAILVGAGTLRKDNPRLIVRDEALIQSRVAQGRSPNPIKVTLTQSGNLEPTAQFFRVGNTEKLVYCPANRCQSQQALLGDKAQVIPVASEPIDFVKLLEDLGRRGVRNLLVEGGTTINSQLLSLDLVDFLRLSIAPKIVGDPNAPRWLQGSEPLPNFGRQLQLERVEQLGQCAVLHYCRRHSL